MSDKNEPQDDAPSWPPDQGPACPMTGQNHCPSDQWRVNQCKKC